VTTCWCGEKNPTFSEAGLERSCGGTGVLHCYCAGDFCMCHRHGEEECLGCSDCEYDDEEGEA
jgi:hypothetical protein